MKESPLVSIEKNFIEAFRLPRDGFSSPIAFDTEFGFSTEKGRLQNGFEFVSAYKFYIAKQALENSDPVKPVWVAVDYGEKQPNGEIRLYPTSIPRKITWPIDFISSNEFFYDIEKGFFTHKGEVISAIDILAKVEKLHTKPTSAQGLGIHLKLLASRFLPWMIEKLFWILIWILYIISGTETKSNIFEFSNPKRFKDTTVVDTESFKAKTVDVFGYKASAWSVVGYAVLHLGIYSYWYFLCKREFAYLKSIFDNSFLVIVYVIPTLIFFERGLPTMLEYCIEQTQKLFRSDRIRRINLKF